MHFSYTSADKTAIQTMYQDQFEDMNHFEQMNNRLKDQY